MSSYDAATINYSCTRLIAFSDEEGGAPFKLPAAAAAAVADDQGIPEFLETYFTFTNGILTGIKKEDVTLAFLGDLVDNEEHSIEVLKALVELKEAKPDQVILIGGNRDFNKIRMGIELYIQDETGAVPWHHDDDKAKLIERLSNGYYFRKKDVPEYLKEVLGDWTTVMPLLEKQYTEGDIKDRVEVMYNKTLGAVLAKTYDELQTIGEFGAIADEQKKAKLLCTMQMVMSFNWDNLPEFLKPYNGLYLRYLRNCHVIATFIINGKTGIMSHGGLPHNFFKGETEIAYRLTSPFGFVAKADTPVDKLSTIIKGIEGEKNNLVDEVTRRRDVGYDNGNLEFVNDPIDKFVHMTAPTTLFEDSFSATSPVVGMQSIPINKRKGDISVLRGGAARGWVGRQKTKEIKRVADGGDLISYDIFGHAPQGFLPTAYRNSHTLYACLDVSKIDGRANSESFAFLEISAEKTRFFGRIKFPGLADTTTIYNASTDKYKDRTIYYDETIPETPIELLPTRQIPGQPIKVDYKKVTVAGRDVYQRQVVAAAAGGRRKTNRRQRSQRRKTRVRKFK